MFTCGGFNGALDGNDGDGGLGSFFFFFHLPNGCDGKVTAAFVARD